MIGEDNYEIHIAVALNHANAVRQILSNNFQWIEAKDEYGDQAAHIACRFGNIESLKVLIEYDASMETRNYNLLTPLGEARINQQLEVIHLLKENYIFRSFDGIERYAYRRIGFSMIPSQTMSRVNARRLRCLEEGKNKEVAKRICALLQLKTDNNAKLIQKWWCFLRIKDSTWITAITKVQSVYRMHKEHSLYWSFNRERLLFYKKCHALATTCQRLWRGHLARAANRKLVEWRTLPNPLDPKNFDIWMRIQEESHPPIRCYGIYKEYVLSGAPKTWEDRRIKRHGKYFRDVKFYVHSVTHRAYWENPSNASFPENKPNYVDFRQSVLKIYRWWKLRILDKRLRLLAKTGRIISAMENLNVHSIDTEDEATLYNYTFFTHVVKKHIELARNLYSTCMSRMKNKGVDNAFILYSFSIFLSAHGSSEEVDELLRRGRVAEYRWKQYHNTNSSIFDVAKCVFHFQAIKNQLPDDWYEYGLCKMVVYKDLKGARMAFNQALRINSKHGRVRAALTSLWRTENVTIRFL